MGALPKKKITTRRKGKRRAAINLAPKNVGVCPQCQQAKLPHQTCQHCGYHHHEAKN